MTRFLRRSALLLLLAGLACATTSQARHSQSFTARRALAQELMRRGDWAGAFRLVDALHREDPRDPGALAMRGVVYREQRLEQEAEADLEEALRLDPEHAYAHANLGILLDQRGRGAEALLHHRRAAELEPLEAGYLNNLGFSLFSQGRPREAIPVLHQALRLDPASPRVRNNLGFAYARTGDFTRAAEQFGLAGPPAQARNNLAFAYQSASNLAQAFELYVEALRLDPGLAVARHNLRELARKLGRSLPPDLLDGGGRAVEGRKST